VRELATLTAAQPSPAPHIASRSKRHLGIEYGMTWAADILFQGYRSCTRTPANQAVPGALAASGLERSRCLLLPGKIHRNLWMESPGIGWSPPAIAGKRTPTRATFREDATAIATTKHWNIIAVGDGAGTAELARVGSN